MGFIIHFYIIFGTNLLIQSPVPVSVFFLVLEFQEKEYQTEKNSRDDFSWTRRYPGGLECMLGKPRGGTRSGGAPPTLVGRS